MVLAAHSHTRYLNKEKVRSWAGDHLYWSVMRRWLFSPTPNNSAIAIQNIEEIIKTTCHQCLMQSWAPCTPRMQSSQRMNHSGGDGEGHTQPVTSFQVDNPTSEGIINKQSLQSVYQYQYQSHEDVLILPLAVNIEIYEIRVSARCTIQILLAFWYHQQDYSSLKQQECFVSNPILQWTAWNGIPDALSYLQNALLQGFTK